MGVAMCYVIEYLSKWSFSYQGVNLIAVHPLLPILDDVIIVIIVVSIVKNFPFFFVTRVFTLTLLVPSLLFCIIHLKMKNEGQFKHWFKVKERYIYSQWCSHKNKTNLIDVFVCFDKVNGKLPQGSWSWVTKALGHVPLKSWREKLHFNRKKGTCI